MKKRTETPTPTTLIDLERQQEHWQGKGREYQGTIDAARETVKAILQGRGALLLRADHGDQAARAELDRTTAELRDAEQRLEDATRMAQAAADELQRLDVAIAAERKNEARRMNAEDDAVILDADAGIEAALRDLVHQWSTRQQAQARQAERSIRADLPTAEVTAMSRTNYVAMIVFHHVWPILQTWLTPFLVEGRRPPIVPGLLAKSLADLGRERIASKLAVTETTPPPAEEIEAVGELLWTEEDERNLRRIPAQ